MCQLLQRIGCIAKQRGFAIDPCALDLVQFSGVADGLRIFTRLFCALWLPGGGAGYPGFRLNSSPGFS